MGFVANGWSMALYTFVGALQLYNGQSTIPIFNKLLIPWMNHCFLLIFLVGGYLHSQE